MQGMTLISTRVVRQVAENSLLTKDFLLTKK